MLNSVITKRQRHRETDACPMVLNRTKKTFQLTFTVDNFRGYLNAGSLKTIYYVIKANLCRTDITSVFFYGCVDKWVQSI